MLKLKKVMRLVQASQVIQYAQTNKPAEQMLPSNGKVEITEKY